MNSFLRVITLIGICWARSAGWELAQENASLPPGSAAKQELSIVAGKSLVIDSPGRIARVAVGNGEVVEAVAVTPREIVLNGKLPGKTSLIVWQEGGQREAYDVSVLPGTDAVEAVREEMKTALPGQEISLRVENNSVFLHGVAKDRISAMRAVAIASSLGKVINLLRVTVPPVSAQVLLKVRFADVDRAASSELGANLLSTGALNTIGTTTTGQFTAPQVKVNPNDTSFTLADALNVFLFRRDLNLGVTIKALQSRRLLEILAEPNLLAIDGRPASFLAGGEFPYPTLQGGGAGLGAVTIQFREFGVRITFVPQITPRGTIRLEVTPEVSALDFANGLVFQGFTIPGLSTRRVRTEIELEDGQSFAIAGLLDNRVTETLSKIHGLGDIPLLGKLFQSRALNKSNTELLVLVTPEVVYPIPSGAPVPEIPMPKEFLSNTATAVPRTPGVETTGQPRLRQQESIPIEQLMESQMPLPSVLQQGQGPVQFPIPVVMPVVPQPDPKAVPAPGEEQSPRP